MGPALQAVLAGISVGAVYGLVGLGFTLVHRLVRVLNLAHGDVVTGAVFLGVLAVVGRTPVAASLDPARSVALAALAVLAGAVLSAAVYAVTVRPFLADAAGWVAGGIAAGLLIRTALGLALPAAAYAVPDPLHLDALGVLHLPGGTTTPGRVLGVLTVGLAAGLLAERFVTRSRLGVAMRAVADDTEAAALCGVPVARVVLAGFVVAGGLAALAGVLAAPGRTLAVDAGVVLGLKGAAAALLGRLGSVRGALLGGVALGVVEQAAVATPALGAGYVDVLPLAVLVVVLALRPEGLRAAPRAVPE
jgi:branched-subunit amino acid ABC-type transport system permease component